jgi:hypothetical protein
VYSKAGEVFDPTKKGGRWKPEFIWQTNWQEALKRQEDLERQQAEYRQRLADGSIDEEKAKGPGRKERLAQCEESAIVVQGVANCLGGGWPGEAAGRVQAEAG